MVFLSKLKFKHPAWVGRHERSSNRLWLVNLGSKSYLNTTCNATLKSILISFRTGTGGTAPYYPSIVMGGDISNVLKRFQETNSMSQLWNVDLPVGITVQFIIGDSAGNSAPSAISSSAIAAGNSDDW